MYEYWRDVVTKEFDKAFDYAFRNMFQNEREFFSQEKVKSSLLEICQDMSLLIIDRDSQEFNNLTDKLKELIPSNEIRMFFRVVKNISENICSIFSYTSSNISSLLYSYLLYPNRFQQ